MKYIITSIFKALGSSILISAGVFTLITVVGYFICWGEPDFEFIRAITGILFFPLFLFTFGFLMERK